MADEGYTSSAAWETDHSELHSVSSHSRPPLRSLDSTGSSSPHLKSFSPLPRSSTDSAGPSQWRDSPTVSVERRDTLASFQTQVEAPSLVESNFDESVLRTLCDLDVRSFAQSCLALKTNEVIVWSTLITGQDQA
jgi:Rho GTPase-activating protein RGD1